MSADEVAATLGVTRQYVSLLARGGKLRAYRGSRRRHLFDPKDVTVYKRSSPSNNNPVPISPRENA
jgi:excisionase family DNA binding protein